MPREKIKFALRISPEVQQLVKDMCPRDNRRPLIYICVRVIKEKFHKTGRLSKQITGLCCLEERVW